MNDATEIYILKKRIAYLESLLSAHNISFDEPNLPVRKIKITRT